jgi:hypothetical protein
MSPGRDRFSGIEVKTLNPTLSERRWRTVPLEAALMSAGSPELLADLPITLQAPEFLSFASVTASLVIAPVGIVEKDKESLNLPRTVSLEDAAKSATVPVELAALATTEHAPAFWINNQATELVFRST